jgi:FKBP-type peptidyl-prolyl cis-trans isomerase 2
VEQAQGIVVVVGEEHVGEAVAVHVDKAEAGVSTLCIDDARAFGERERELLPRVVFIVQGKDGILFVVADDQFTPAVAVEVAETDAAVAATIGR